MKFIAIPWPISEPILSEKDQTGEQPRDLTERLPHYQGNRG